jgi:hypothetical protein
MDNSALTRRVLGLPLVHPVSRRWKDYWQRVINGKRFAGVAPWPADQLGFDF